MEDKTMTKYRVIKDLQGGSFGMYRDFTVEKWREQAIEWADMDDNEELIAVLECLKDEKVIPFIADFWELEFEAVN